jgi:hypothetical protein
MRAAAIPAGTATIAAAATPAGHGRARAAGATSIVAAAPGSTAGTSQCRPVLNRTSNAMANVVRARATGTAGTCTGQAAPSGASADRLSTGCPDHGRASHAYGAPSTVANTGTAYPATTIIGTPAVSSPASTGGPVAVRSRGGSHRPAATPTSAARATWTRVGPNGGSTSVLATATATPATAADG